jgi:sugar phosphate permease
LLPWGLLADRLDERLVIVVGLAGAGAALVGAGWTDSYPSLVGVLIAAGALGASVNAASGRAIMGWFRSDQLGLALGIRQTAVPIGGAAAAAGLPWLASSGGTRLAFVVLGCGCVGGALVAGALMRGSPKRTAPELGDVTQPLRDRKMWLLGGGAALFVTAQIATTGFLVLFLHEHRGVSTHAAAGVLAGINVLSIGARIGAGRWSDRMRARLRPVGLIGLTLAAATVAVAALVDAPLALLIPALVVAGVLSMSWNGLAFAAAAEAAGPTRTGAALGFQQTLLGVVIAGVPPAFAVIAAGSWRLAFALSAIGPLLGVLALRAVPESKMGTVIAFEGAAPPPV